jgi:hypothetical protein
MIKFMQLGYFHTIETIYKTWNFDLSVILNGSIPLTSPSNSM